MTKAKLGSLGLSLLILVLLVVWMATSDVKVASKEAPDEPQVQDAERIRVEIETLEATRYQPTLKLQGQLEPWRSVLRNYDIQMANVDLFGDGTPERFAWLEGSEYKVGQASPYFIFSDTGEVLMQGTFIDRPYLFHLKDRKATALIAHNGSGFTTKILE